MIMYGGIGVTMTGAIGLVFWGLSAANGYSRKNARHKQRLQYGGSSYDADSWDLFDEDTPFGELGDFDLGGDDD